jgi:hypothetical protein
MTEKGAGGIGLEKIQIAKLTIQKIEEGRDG